jgi:hypothetical protein
MSEIEVKSYRYLRTAMVALLVGLGAAVFYQTWRQGFHLLGSVSAYYYTPAQAMFVGGLIGLGACMIALKGTTTVEDIALNLGGMFAAVVAIVPTARGADFATAVRACENAAGPLLTQKASTGLDCPTVRALAQAGRANVENNTVALLVVGGLGLLATVLFARKDARSGDPAGGSRRQLWWGVSAAFVVWAASGSVLWADNGWFIDNAHYLAALGLFLSLFVVAVANALRRQGALLRSPARFDRYAWLAWLMVVTGVIMGGLVYFQVITLFWLEIVVVLLFVVLWMVQTVERMGDE